MIRTLLKLYVSFIRPHLEYAAASWDPFLKKDIELIEDVQKFALRVCLKSWSATYAELLEQSNLPSLQTRRQHAKFCNLFKIINEATDGYPIGTTIPPFRPLWPAPELLEQSNLPSLQLTRRQHAKLCHLFKIINEASDGYSVGTTIPPLANIDHFGLHLSIYVMSPKKQT